MKAKILISILAIALVAGCVVPGLEIPGGPIIGVGNGLEITSFTAQPDTLFSGSTVKIIMEVENKGGTTVTSSPRKAIAYLTGSNIQFNTSTPPSSGMLWYTSSGAYQELKEMKSEDVVRGIEGGTDRITWTLNSPSIPRGQVRTDSFMGRVYCDYKTTAHGSVWIYTETEYEASRTAGRSVEKSSFTYTKAPVGLDVSVQPDPVVLYGGDTTFSLNIKITNLATGTIYKPGNITYSTSTSGKTLVSEALNKVNLSINKTSGLTITNTDCEGEQELVAGRPTTVICDFNITESISDLTFKSYPLAINIDYGYFTQREATVTVQGK